MDIEESRKEINCSLGIALHSPSFALRNEEWRLIGFIFSDPAKTDEFGNVIKENPCTPEYDRVEAKVQTLFQTRYEHKNQGQLDKRRQCGGNLIEIYKR